MEPTVYEREISSAGALVRWLILLRQPEVANISPSISSRHNMQSQRKKLSVFLEIKFHFFSLGMGIS